MRKKILTVALSIGTFGAYSQVGIGTLLPNKSAMLDVVAQDKGVLIPRVALQNTLDVTTVAGSFNGSYDNSLLVFNKTNNSEIKPGYYYWYENKWNRILNQSDLLNIDTNTKNTSISVVNGILKITDTENNSVTVSLSDLNVITTLTNNLNGTYTYTSESGLSTMIDIPSEVQTYFQQIVSDPNVNDVLESIVSNTKSMVKYDGNNFTYIDASGSLQTIEWTTVIQANQKTSMLANGENTLVQSQVDDANASNTIWRVNVATSKGSQNGNSAQLGVVKEKSTNPEIKVSESGELLLNLEEINKVKQISSNYNVLIDDSILLGDASSTNISITLPNANSNKGKRLIIKKEDNNENFYITVLGTISGVTGELYTALPYSGWEFVSDGTQWKIINKF